MQKQLARTSPAWHDLAAHLPGDLEFAFRTAIAALIALYAAMWLQLDTPRWAAWTVLTVSLPSPERAFSKAWHRMIGTLVGAVMGVVFAALFAQAPLEFIAAMAFWGAFCVYVGTRARGYQTYALALTWLTTAIVAMGSLANPNAVLMVALTRTAEVTLGVVAAWLAAALVTGHKVQDLPEELSPVPGQARRNATRAAIAVALAGLFWYVSEWQNGPDFIIWAGVASTLFAAHPSKLSATLGMLRGILFGTMLGIAVHFLLLTTSADFLTLALILLPFLMLGGIGVADVRTMGPATGYNLAFITAADPARRMVFNLAATLNTSLAMVLGLLFSVACFLAIVPIRELLHRDAA